MTFDIEREIALENARQLERLGVWPVECAIPWFLRKRFVSGYPHIEGQYLDLTRLRHE